MPAKMDQDATLENQEQTHYPVQPPDRYGIHISYACGRAESRKGVCSIGSPYHVHVCVLVAGCYRTVYIYDCTICLDDSVKVASPYWVHY